MQAVLVDCQDESPLLPLEQASFLLFPPIPRPVFELPEVAVEDLEIMLRLVVQAEVGVEAAKL